MDFLSYDKLVDIAFDKGVMLFAFFLALVAKPLTRKLKVLWFRKKSSRYADIFSGLENDTITVQAGEPYFRFQDIRLHNAPRALILGLPQELHVEFSKKDLLDLVEKGVALDWNNGQCLHFENREKFTDFLSAQLGIPVSDYLPSILTGVARDFISNSNGCLFNGAKYGILKYQISRTNDEREFPILNLYCFDTDYFTDRVLTELWKKVPKDIRQAQTELKKHQVIPFLSCSLGVNCVVVCADDKILITERSARVGLSTSLKHISMNEGLTQTDRDSGGTPSAKLCLLRGLREELGIQEVDILKMEFGDFFLERNHFQFGLTAVVHIAMGSQELRHSVSKDRTLETDAFEFLDLHESNNLIDFLQSSRPQFVPHGYYALLRILLREKPSILRGARDAKSSRGFNIRSAD